MFLIPLLLNQDLEGQNKLLIKQKETSKEIEKNYLGKKNKIKITNISIWN